MIIHLEICDYCNRQARGVAMARFSVEGATFDVCAQCQSSKPFRRLRPSERGVALQKVIAMALEP